MKNTMRKQRHEKKEQNAIRWAWEYLLLVFNMIVNCDNLF